MVAGTGKSWRLSGMELAALIELLVDRLHQPRFAQIHGANELIDNLQRVHGDLLDEIAAANRSDPG
jgi:iron-sulfur cluster repair protein YtfE (RIC family)